MALDQKSRAPSASTTSRSRWATSRKRWRSMAGCSSSSCAARARPWRSSTWATSSSPCRKAARRPPDDGRHFGLVVDDKEAVRRPLKAAGVKALPGRFLDFRDPWGNRIEIVGYDNIQFTKAPNVLRGMGLEHLAKNESAIKELARRAWRSVKGRSASAAARPIAGGIASFARQGNYICGLYGAHLFGAAVVAPRGSAENSLRFQWGKGTNPAEWCLLIPGRSHSFRVMLDIDLSINYGSVARSPVLADVYNHDLSPLPL